jgi:hypothetical protein
LPKQKSFGSNISMYDSPGARRSARLSGKELGRRAFGATHLTGLGFFAAGFFFFAAAAFALSAGGSSGSKTGTSISSSRRRTSAGILTGRAPSLSMRRIHWLVGEGATTQRRTSGGGRGGGSGSFGLAGAAGFAVLAGAAAGFTGCGLAVAAGFAAGVAAGAGAAGGAVVGAGACGEASAVRRSAPEKTQAIVASRLRIVIPWSLRYWCI